MKIETKWNSGNFTLGHVTEVTEAQRDILAKQGLLWFAQRNREHDVVLGAYTTVAGKKVRREGWKRQDVEFDAKLADALTAAYGSFEVADGVKVSVDTTVTEYVRENAEPKYAQAAKAMARHESANDLETWLKDKIGFDGDTHGADGEYNVDALKAIDAYVKAQVAAI